MFSSYFIHHPKFAMVISITLTLAGVLAIKLLPINLYPAISPVNIMVAGTYPGASAEVVEATVGVPIEDAVNGVEDMIYMNSRSTDDGSYRLTVTFKVGADPDMALVRVQNRVRRAEPSLPTEVTAIGLHVIERSPDTLKMISFQSPDGSLDYKFISNYVKINVLGAIARLEGVSSVNFFGEAEYAMRLWLNPDKLAVYGLSVHDVAQALREQNVQVAAGKIGAPPFEGTLQTEYTLRTKGRLQDVEEFENIILRAHPDGSAIYLRDVARVELGQSNYGVVGQANGLPAVNLVVFQQANANALQVGRAVDDLLARASGDFPRGMEYVINHDTTRYMKTAVRQVMLSLFAAVVLVIAVTYVFLGNWRAALVPTLAIPVSLVSSFVVLLLTGMSINTVTLFGLILAIGIVVDDAILVVENCERHLREDPDLSPVSAAEITMREVSGAIVATTLVLLAVFAPVALMPGITGVMYRQFAVTICVAVLFSSLVALTLSPALCGQLLRPGEPHAAAWFRRFQQGFLRLSAAYGQGVDWVQRHLRLVVLIFLAWMTATVFGLIRTPGGFIPPEDQGALYVSVQLPDAASMPRTQDAMRKVTAILQADPAVESVTAIMGYSLLSGAHASNAGTLFVELIPWSERTDAASSVFSVAQRTNSQAFIQVPEAAVFALTLPAIPGVGAVGGLEFMLQDTLSRPPAQLAGALNQLLVEANQNPALRNVFSTFRANVPQYFIDIDRVKAKNLGVSLSEIFATLQAQVGSLYINDFNKFGQTYKVVIQAESQYRSDLSDLDKYYVRSEGGNMVPLSALATTRPILGPDIVTRYNLFRAAPVNGIAAPGYSSGEAMRALEAVAGRVLPAGYTWDWTGTAFQERAAGQTAVYAYLLALLFIYLFLVAQYESWSVPAAIILVVPMAVGGALLMLNLSGTALNLYAQIGIVLLIGMAAKHAILIVEFARTRREVEGLEIPKAASEAGRLRFRAVCMTAVSFILGILPLALASGAGAAGQRSLGLTVLGGMLAALLVGTVFIPGFYVIVQTLRERIKARLGQAPLPDRH